MKALAIGSFQTSIFILAAHVVSAAPPGLPPVDSCTTPNAQFEPSNGNSLLITDLKNTCPSASNPEATCDQPLATSDTINDGAGRWDSSCDRSGTGFPSVALDLGPRPMRPGELALELEIIEGQRMVGGQAKTPGTFIPIRRMIQTGPDSFSPVMAGGKVRVWTRDENDNPTNIADTVAHELGHALGLAHPLTSDMADCSEAKRIMGQRPLSGSRVIAEEDCNRADRRWLTDDQNDISEPVPEPWSPRPPPPWGNGIDPCVIEPSLPGCSGGPGEPPLWNQCNGSDLGGYLQIERTFCYFFQGQYYCDVSIIATLAENRQPANVHFDQTNWDCSGSTSFAAQTDGPEAVGGSGPRVVFIRPAASEILAGQASIGVAVSQPSVSGRPIGFFVDGTQVLLGSFAAGTEVTGLCSNPGIVDPECPYIGWSGLLDTTAFSNGPYELQVLSMDNAWPNPRLTWATRTVVIDNGNPPPPPPPGQPEIVVVRQWDSQPVLHGGGYDFGSWDVGDLPQARTFLVCNDGTARLDITSIPQIVSGSGFSKGTGPAGMIAPGNCSQLQLRFEVEAPGSYTGTATIHSNDPDGDYTFSLTGIGTGIVDTEAPRTFIGNPLSSATVSGTIVVRGWAIDAASLSEASLSFRLDGQPLLLADVFYGLPRSGACDIHSDLGSPDCPDVGWRGDFDTTTVSNGPHTLTLEATDPSGNLRVRSVGFVVDNPTGDTEAPRILLDKPSGSGDVAFGQFIATGWALDESQLTPMSFAFTVDGQARSLSSFVYGFPAQGVCDLYPALSAPNCPNVRWRGYLDTVSLPNGWHTFTVTVTDTFGNARSASSDFFVDNRPPVGVVPRVQIELPTHGTTITGSYLFRGWAIDDRALSVADIRFELDGWWIDPGVVYGDSRADICSTFGSMGSPNCPHVGWTISSGTDGLYNGNHILRLIVTDQDGNRAVFDRSFNTSN